MSALNFASVLAIAPQLPRPRTNVVECHRAVQRAFARACGTPECWPTACPSNLTEDSNIHRCGSGWRRGRARRFLNSRDLTCWCSSSTCR